MQAIERTFAILRAIAAQPNGIGVSQIAEQTQLPKGTVSRFLTALEVEAAVYRSDDNKFSIGTQIKALFGQPTFIERLVMRARPMLTSINQETQEAVGLSILDGQTVTYIDHLASSHSVQVVDWTGRSVPLHVSSAGKLFLAFGREKFVDHYLSTPLQQFTRYTITDTPQLRLALGTIRASGYATTNEEFAEDTIGYSVPLWSDHDTPIAAITLYGPKYRFDPTTEQALIALLQGHARLFERDNAD